MASHGLMCVTVVLTLLIPESASQLSVCGRASRNTRIVGGVVAPLGSWPWQVSLHRSGSHFCGGSLINDQWVLSAAHCVEGTTAGQITVYLGRQSQTGSNPNEVSRSVSQIISHPNYIRETSDNDIALLRLSSPVTFTDYIVPVCLAGSDSSVHAGVDTWVTGWGALMEDGRIPNQLMEVDVPVVGNRQCNCYYGVGQITDNMICAGVTEGGRDSCQGDSGGPLVTKQGDVWIEIGVVSFGSGCARPESPGVYARVSRYMSWINSQISRNQPGYVTFTSTGTDSDLSVTCTGLPPPATTTTPPASTTTTTTKRTTTTTTTPTTTTIPPASTTSTTTTILPAKTTNTTTTTTTTPPASPTTTTTTSTTTTIHSASTTSTTTTILPAKTTNTTITTTPPASPTTTTTTSTTTTIHPASTTSTTTTILPAKTTNTTITTTPPASPTTTTTTSTTTTIHPASTTSTTTTILPAKTTNTTITTTPPASPTTTTTTSTTTTIHPASTTSTTTTILPAKTTNTTITTTPPASPTTTTTTSTTTTIPPAKTTTTTPTTSSTTTPTTSTTTTTTPNTTPKPVVCGQAPLNSRIGGGGSVASAGIWPWMTSLQRNGAHVCGGTLVSVNTVMSDAGCFTSSSVASEWTVVLGRLQQSGSNPFEMTLNVANITLSSLSGSNVALLGLSTQPTLTNYIQPICLDNGRTFAVGSTCWAAGWNSGRGGAQQVLQEIQTSVANCGNASSADNICTSSFTLEQGDSGGPLMCQQDGSWFQAAVLTTGNNSNRQVRAETVIVFSSVRRFQSFLRANLGPLLSPVSSNNSTTGNTTATPSQITASGGTSKPSTSFPIVLHLLVLVTSVHFFS